MGSHEVVVVGEALFDFFPLGPDGLGSDRYERRPGGAPANVAVGLSRLGHPPLFWTRVGDDIFGAQLARTLSAYGLPEAGIERDPSAKTTLAFVDPPNESFLFYRARGAETRLHPEAAPAEEIESAAWLACGGVSLSASPAREAVTRCLRLADAAGTGVLFDPNYRPELWGGSSFPPAVHDRLPFVDVLTATRGELEILFPDHETLEDRVEAAHTAGPHTVCVTEGAAGARLFADRRAPWGRGAVHHPGFTVDAVDSVGAGDAFNAGLLAAVLSGERDPAGLLTSANAVAALATTERGAMSALPEREAVDDFLAQAGPADG